MLHTIPKYLPYIAISFCAILWNVLTIHNQLPWMDEVMLADTPANMLLYGEWRTTAYNAMGEGTFPFSTYMPLYQWILYGWISIFGFSFLSVRLFEILTYFVLGGSILYCLKYLRNKDTNISEQCVFSIGFWFTGILIITYRIGRPDILSALMAVGLLFNIWKSLAHNELRTKYIVIFAALTIMAGIQSVVWIVSALVFTCLFVRPVKKLYKPSLYAIWGFIVGFFTTSFFMWYHGALKAFYVGLMQVSGTFYKLWQILRVYLLPLLGRNVKPIGDLPEGEGFFTRILSVGKEPSTIILIFIILILVFYNKPTKLWRERTLAFSFGIFGLFVVLFFALAGRYQVYYQWTSVIPLVISLMLWYNHKNKIVNKILVGVSMFVIVLLSFNNFGSINDKRYDNMRDFINHQNFEASSHIAAPMMTFYELRPNVKNTYFYEIYPTDRIQQIDYLIIPQPTKDINPSYYDYISMQNYYNQLVDEGYLLHPLDSISNPALMIYKVTK